MSELTTILGEIVRAEYSQFMRYTYLSALGYGPFADELTEHFAEHAENELEHAARVCRWIVDLGSVPPTDMEPVEPFNGTLDEALEWLIEAEIRGIDKYQAANELAHGIIGLQNDIGDLLSVEHEHLSDLLKWTKSQAPEEIAPVVIVLASSYRKFAANTRLFRRYARTKKSAEDVRGYLRELLEMAWFKHTGDYTYDKGRQYILEDTQKSIERLWARHQAGEDVQSALQFNVDLYKKVSSLNGNQWKTMHEWVWPDHLEWLHSDDPKKVEPEEPSFPQTMEQIEPELKKPRPPKVEIEKQVQPSLAKSVQFPGVGEEPQGLRRPIEQAGRLFVYDVGKSRSGVEPTVEVGIGDKIKNMTLEGEGVPGPGRPGRSKHNEGTIDEITPDGLLMVTTGVGKQEWDTQVDLIEIDARERQRILSKQPLGESHG